VLITVGCQTPWRAEDFRATGLPFVVADIPGYQLDCTYADVGVIFLQYRDVAGQNLVIDASINRRPDPAATAAQTRGFALAGGHYLYVGRPARSGNSDDRRALPDGITVRPVSATYLAAYPTSYTSLPD